MAAIQIHNSLLVHEAVRLKNSTGKISSSLSWSQAPHPHIKILNWFVFLKFIFKTSYISRKGKVLPLQTQPNLSSLFWLGGWKTVGVDLGKRMGLYKPYFKNIF